eukprot:CAMPEP_0173440118 /NCGR_PEP_ID=MMETSP1357-20121228/22267_1 /TAXON_ID=77926 /ORGANISM="Hemiselmis rufescens, Strain PCC563" /LENGTH=361 /DNA_ID=CAMNT_0014405569 /DNA_START=64 /DNA_END=1145 /DNA_ORIENTATION=-
MARSRGTCLGRANALILLLAFIDLVIVLAIGALSWLATWQTMQFEPAQWNDLNVWIQQTNQHHRQWTIHGRVTEEIVVRVRMASGADPQPLWNGVTQCTINVDENFWFGGVSAKCREDLEDLSEWQALVGARICQYYCMTIQDLIVNAMPEPSCDLLEKRAQAFAVSNPLGRWEEQATCTVAKGALSVLVFSLALSTAALFFASACDRCKNYRVAMVASVACAILCLVTLLTYGVAVSGRYPFGASQIVNLEYEAEMETLAAADTRVAAVQSGFIMVVVAAVCSLGATWVAWAVWRKDKLGHNLEEGVGAEMVQVVSAVPITASAVPASWLESSGASATAPMQATDPANIVVGESLMPPPG